MEPAGLYKTEPINREKCWFGTEVEQEAAQWVRGCNTIRLHSSLRYLWPTA